MTLAALGFAPSTADPSLFLRTDTSLPPFYVLVYIDASVFANAETKALALVKLDLQKRQTCTDLGPSALRPPVLLATVHSSAYRSLALSYTFRRVQHWAAIKRVLRYLCSTSGMGLVLGGRGPVVLTGHADASWVDDLATQRSSQGYTFSLGSGSVSWRATLADLPADRPGRATLFFSISQRGQLRLAYVATRANTADIFTKALQSGDHQRLAVAHNSTTLPCLAVPSEEAICSDASTGALLATFTREPLSGLFILHTASHQVAEASQVTASPQVAESGQVTESPTAAASSQVAASGQVAASCSCRSFAHPIVLWHHRLGHPSIPRLRGMASHRLVSSLPRVFASLPPSPAPPCTPCVAGHLHTTPHSSSLRPATAPFQTLHLDVWGPAPTQGLESERYFLVVVDAYSRYTTVFPLAKMSEVISTLIRWLLATKGTRGRRVSYLHSDRGGEGFTDQSLDRVPWCWVGLSCLGIPCACPRHLCGQALGSRHLVCLPCASFGAGGASFGGVGAGGAGTGGVSSRGAGARGAGTGGASSGGAGAGGAGTGGASSGGAGFGGTDTVCATSGDTGTRGASSEETRVGDTTSAVPAQPPHRHDTRLQAAHRRAREEQEQLERERQELRQLDLLEQQEQQQEEEEQ
ncbi:unnamed protein product [Closterium sp. NIES-53]